MEELLKKVFGFFENEKISISRKIAIPVLFLLIILSLNNIWGISYYVISGIEVDYIIKIEDAKMKCKSDSIAQLHLDNMMKEALHRRNILQWFASLFENTNIEKAKVADYGESKVGTLYKMEHYFPTLEKNQMWHTITSSLLWLILFSLVLLVLLFSPFIIKEDKITTIIALIFTLSLLVFLIWGTQWLFSLIPIIKNRAYINYIIQLILNLIPIIFLAPKLIKELRN